MDRRRKPQAPNRWPPSMTQENIEVAIDNLCGCKGSWDCDCVSVFNRARSNAWWAYNGGGKEPKSAKDLKHEQARQSLERNLDYDDAPECVDCGEYYPPARHALGYRTCLDCGSPRKSYALVPVPKSNYIIATSADQVKSPYSHKGNK